MPSAGVPNPMEETRPMTRYLLTDLLGDLADSETYKGLVRANIGPVNHSCKFCHCALSK